MRMPYKLTSKKYTADFNEVKSLGGDGVTTPSARTADQTQLALFWVESSPLGWNRIARIVATAEGLDPWENARLFGLLNMALTDGYIGGFEAKIHHNFWRPVTAIQLADIDGNPATEADPAWTPLAPTPPVPDHPSTHSVEGGAAAQVLKRFFKEDQISFSTCSLTMPLSQSSAADRQKCCVRLAVSPMQRTRTGSHVSWSGSIFATQSMMALSMAERSAIALSICS